ncbi:MAG TPA: hypothetical protein VJ484_02795 [Lysobacter sp.]|nr:hypothetical protein [Lysobacter sp.]
MESLIQRTLAACMILLCTATSGEAIAGQITQNASNTAPILITHFGPASPYGSEITVANLHGQITDVTVTLNGITHTFPDDIEVLLVAPSGQKIKLMSDVGGATDLRNVSLSFSGSSSAKLPDSAAIAAGTYLPSDTVEGDPLPSPAPAAPYSMDMFTLNGPAQNGIWRLYVADDMSGDTGQIAGGWTLSITSEGFDSCAAEGYGGSQYALCRQICEADRSRSQGLNGLLNAWSKQFGTRPPCMD